MAQEINMIPLPSLESLSLSNLKERARELQWRLNNLEYGQEICMLFSKKNYEKSQSASIQNLIQKTLETHLQQTFSEIKKREIL